MAELRPFRQYNENDVVNFFSFDAFPAGVPVTGAVTKGSMVRIKNGWEADHEFDLEAINNSYPNTVSDRWHVHATIELANNGGITVGEEDNPLGMLLYDVSEYDENGEKLIWHPRKYHEMQVALLGHAVPVLMRGLVLMRGIDEGGGDAAAGQQVYAVQNGLLSTDNQGDSTSTVDTAQVGVCLGGKAADTGDVLMKLDVGLGAIWHA